jgi:hypothetical protein
MLRSQNYATLNCSQSRRAPAVAPLKIDFVPELPLAGMRMRSGGTSGCLRLTALFKADGNIEEIRPYPLLPYGVPETEAGKGQFVDYTALIIDGQFVKKLPPGFAEEVKEQVRGMRFTPKLLNGQPVSQWVMVNTDFQYIESPDTTVGASFHTTVMDDSGVVWHGYSIGGGWIRGRGSER